MSQQKGVKRAAKVLVRKRKMEQATREANLKRLARAASAHEHEGHDHEGHEHESKPEKKPAKKKLVKGTK